MPIIYERFNDRFYLNPPSVKVEEDLYMKISSRLSLILEKLKNASRLKSGQKKDQIEGEILSIRIEIDHFLKLFGEDLGSSLNKLYLKVQKEVMDQWDKEESGSSKVKKLAIRVSLNGLKAIGTTLAAIPVSTVLGIQLARGKLGEMIEKMWLPASKRRIEEVRLEPITILKRFFGVKIRSEGTANLDACVFPSDSRFLALRFNKRLPTVVLFNPNNCLYEERYMDVQEYVKMGYNVVLFNYRGVGESEGKIFQGEDLIKDGKAVLKYVRGLYDNEKGADGKILLHGQSIGGGAATGVAAENPDVHLLNERSFSRLSDAVEGIVGKYFTSFATKVISKVAKGIMGELDSISHLNRRLEAGGKGKTLIITAKKDEIIRENAKIVRYLRDSRIVFVTVHRGGHTNLIDSKIRKKSILYFKEFSYRKYDFLKRKLHYYWNKKPFLRKNKEKHFFFSKRLFSCPLPRNDF